MWLQTYTKVSHRNTVKFHTPRVRKKITYIIRYFHQNISLNLGSTLRLISPYQNLLELEEREGTTHPLCIFKPRGRFQIDREHRVRLDLLIHTHLLLASKGDAQQLAPSSSIHRGAFCPCRVYVWGQWPEEREEKVPAAALGILGEPVCLVHGPPASPRLLIFGPLRARERSGPSFCL